MSQTQLNSGISEHDLNAGDSALKQNKHRSRSNDYYARVADKIIEKIREGTAPWMKKSWDDGGYGSLPINPVTGKQYRGGNCLFLMAQDYADPRWMTYRQAESIGAQVRKGEKGTPVIYWKFTEEKKEKDENGQEVTKTMLLERPLCRLSYAFNAEQIDGLPSLTQQKEPQWNPEERVEAILANSGANIVHRAQNRAFYRPADDTIHLPNREQFATSEDYYGVALHELGHWTGHESRLNRPMENPFGSEEYAKEELRAQISSFMLGQELGIYHNLDETASYVDSWIKALQDDPREIFRAAADAEKIMEYVMSFELKQEQQVVQEASQQQEAHLNNVKEQDASLKNSSEQERHYLHVPFAEKNEAKALGAKWDRRQSSWYAPQGANLDKFQKWMQPAQDTAAKQEMPPARSSQKREYLAVPYAERNLAKAAGAKWDSVAKSWYAGEKADVAKLARWMPGNQPEQAPAMTPREEFAEALRGIGCHVEGEHPIMDGKTHRIATEGDKKGERSGFYVGHMDGHPAGYIKNNRSGEEMRWKSSGMPPLSAQQREKFQAECAQRREEHAREISEQQERAALRVLHQLSDLKRAQEPTQYLKSKGITVHKGIFVGGKGTTTYIPAQDANDKIWTMQYIQEDGTKRFAREARKEGCFHVVGGMDALKSASVLVISEGYATAATLTECLKIPTIAAFDAGNLASVAKSLHEKYPNKPIVIAGDDDRHLQESQGKNPGREKAIEAAKLVGGQAVFPKFAPDEDGRAFKDWNDLGTQSRLGRDAVARQMRPVLEKTLAHHKRQAAKQVQSTKRGYSR